MLHVSSLLTMPMPRDQKISIRCITSSQSRNGPPWTVYFPSSKTRQMTAQERACCPMLVVIGCGSISCLPIPHRSPSVKLCSCLYCTVSRLSRSQDPHLIQKDADLCLGNVRVPRCSREKCPGKDCIIGASVPSSGGCGRQPSCTIYGDAERIHKVRWYCLHDILTLDSCWGVKDPNDERE